MTLQNHHLIWLSVHTHRSIDWLKEKLVEGFDIHHLDGNHNNDDPTNLVLMEHTDHMMIHFGVRFIGRLRPPKRKKKKRRVIYTPPRRIILNQEEMKSTILLLPPEPEPPLSIEEEERILAEIRTVG